MQPETPAAVGATEPAGCFCNNTVSLPIFLAMLAAYMLLLLFLPAQVYFEALAPGEERSLEYKFRLAPQVGGRWSVAVWSGVRDEVHDAHMRDGGEGARDSAQRARRAAATARSLVRHALLPFYPKRETSLCVVVPCANPLAPLLRGSPSEYTTHATSKHTTNHRNPRRTHTQVPTRDFQVAVHLIYEDVEGTGYYSNTAFNGTIEVVEVPRLVDFEGLFMYIMIAALFGGGGECRVLLLVV